jgi:hypothetical protein
MLADAHGRYVIYVDLLPTEDRALAEELAARIAALTERIDALEAVIQRLIPPRARQRAQRGRHPPRPYLRPADRRPLGPRIGAAELAHLKRTLQIRFLSHLLGKHSIQTAPAMQLSQGRLVGCVWDHHTRGSQLLS